jgi:hypothetical protein
MRDTMNDDVHAGGADARRGPIDSVTMVLDHARA